MKVVLGAHDLRQNNTLHDVKKIIIHPDWDPSETYFTGDISLILLKNSIEFNNFIQPVCLPKRDFNDNTGVLVGWGLKNDLELSNIARKVNLPILSLSQCIRADYRLSLVYWEESFCAGKKSLGACEGDSGSGLYIRKNGKFYLIGIVSSTVVDSCTETNIAVYSKVYEYQRFITQLIKPASISHNSETSKSATTTDFTFIAEYGKIS